MVKGRLSNFGKSIGKMIEGKIHWAKSNSSGIADAGIDIVKQVDMLN